MAGVEILEHAAPECYRYVLGVGRYRRGFQARMKVPEREDKTLLDMMAESGNYNVIECEVEFQGKRLGMGIVTIPNGFLNSFQKQHKPCCYEWIANRHSGNRS